MSKSWQRTVRMAVILPPLLFVAVYGYWRFLGSESFRRLVERLLARTLRAEVVIGKHEIGSPARIVLRDLAVEFLAEGVPSGVSFRAQEATARARRFLGLGALERVELMGPEARLDGPLSALTRLDLLARPSGRPAVKRLDLKQMAISFGEGGRQYRVSGMDLGMDLSGGKLALSADLGEVRVEGIRSAALEAEAPDVSFGIEIDGRLFVLKDLEVSGASGWRAEGKVRAHFVGAVPEIQGELQLWDLPVRRVYTPPEGVEISELAMVRRTYAFEGQADDLRVEATTDVPGLTYSDSGLGLSADGVTLFGLRTTSRVNVFEIMRGLFKDDRASPGGP